MSSGHSVRVRRLAARWHGGVSSDLVLALGFMLADFIEELLRIGAGAVGISQAALNCLPLASLALRRSRPLLGLMLLTVVAAASSLVKALLPAVPVGSTDVTVPIIALLVMSYSLGAHATGREVVVGVFQPLLLIVVVDLLAPGRHSLSGALPFFGVFIVGAPVLAGRLVRSRRALVDRLRRQDQDIRAERRARTDAALALERLHVTEQLHEKLVAGIESVVVQASDALDSLGQGGSDAVAGIESRARDLLVETRTVVVSLASTGVKGHLIDDQSLLAGDPVRRPGAEGRTEAALPWAAIAAAAVSVGLLFEIGRAEDVRVPLPVALAGCLLLAAPIALSWRRPLLMTALLWALVAMFVLLVAPLAATFTAISLSFLPPFAVAYFESRGRSLLGLAICCLGAVACFGLEGWAGTLAIVVLAWLAGRVLRERSRLVAELRAGNMVLTEERDARLRAAVLEERARLARDLHDAIGHSLTVVALHAGAARRMWMSDRTRAAASLRTIAQVAADGLLELKMGFSSSGVEVRNGSHAADIEELVQRARDTGLPVSLRIDKSDTVLSPEAERATFRVLREALTNVLNHAPGASADVTVRNSGEHVELVVANDRGNRRPSHSAGSGRGLRGMRERAEACGGTVDWRVRADGGFEVRAQFPTRTVQA